MVVFVVGIEKSKISILGERERLDIDLFTSATKKKKTMRIGMSKLQIEEG